MMAKFLRMIRQARWLKYPDLQWMSQGDIQSDALRDLQTEDNKLSVYRIGSEEITERIVIALAANRNTFSNLDYAIFEEKDLESANIQIRQQTGETPDEEINKLHYDLVNLTVERIVQLAEIVAVAQQDRKLRKQIEAGINLAVHAGHLDKDRLGPQLLAKLENIC